MKLFLLIVISGFFIAADAHPDKKCYASVYCLPWDATGDNHDYTLEWAQVYPPLCETAPDQFGDSTSWSAISAEVYERIEDLENECEMLNASLYRETERVEKQIMTCERKLGFFEEEINEIMHNCTDELARQQNEKKQWLQAMEAAIDKSKMLNISLASAIEEKQRLNESLIETKEKLDEAIEENKKLNEKVDRMQASSDEGCTEDDADCGVSGSGGGTKTSERNKSIDVTQVGGETIKKIVKKFCPVFYDDKCFFFDMRKNLIKNEAESVCTDKGGKLGNIYDETHFNKIITCVRENYLHSESPYAQLWLGMIYENKTVYLSDKTEAKYWKWYSSYPSKTAGYTSVILQVRASASSLSQYMFNTYATNHAYPLCEI